VCGKEWNTKKKRSIVKKLILKVTKKSLLKFERWLNKRDLQWELSLKEILGGKKDLKYNVIKD